MRKTLKLKSLLICMAFVASGLRAELDSGVHIVTSKSGLIVRSVPDKVAPKVGFLPYLAKIRKVKTSGNTSMIDGKESHWFSVVVEQDYKEVEGWVFGGYLSQRMPQIVGAGIPLKSLLAASFKIEGGVGTEIERLTPDQVNPHGFAYVRKDDMVLGPPQYCDLPINITPQTAASCHAIDRIDYTKDEAIFYLSGAGCKIQSGNEEDCPAGMHYSVKIRCTLSRKAIEQSLASDGFIRADLEHCEKLEGATQSNK